MRFLKLPIRFLWSSGFLLGASVFLGITTCAAEIPGYPASVRAFDAREVAMLPHYCMYTQEFSGAIPGGNNPVEKKRWYSVMGDTFLHMHHYCWGLMKTNRALILARSRLDRQFYLGDAIDEFNYVIRHAPSDFVLLPEIFTRKGENLLHLGKVAQGMAE